jgi:putative transcriptional regulator
MIRVRLKADGRIVQILDDGTERAFTPDAKVSGEEPVDTIEADHVRHLRARAGLTQVAFATRIGVPVETVRNWEQGKRTPRGPARALLKLIENAPHVAFAVLGTAKSPA